MAVHPRDLAVTLVRRQRRIERAATERARELRGLVATEVRRLRTEGLVERAWLIGSLAAGSFGPGSDVDIVTEGLPQAEHAAVWDRLTGLLASRVDLLRLEELPASFRERVLAEGEAIDVT